MPGALAIYVDGSYRDPDAYLWPQYHSSQAGSWSAASWYQNPEFDALIEEGRMLVDPGRAQGYLRPGPADTGRRCSRNLGVHRSSQQRLGQGTRHQRHGNRRWLRYPGGHLLPRIVDLLACSPDRPAIWQRRSGRTLLHEPVPVCHQTHRADHSRIARRIDPDVSAWPAWCRAIQRAWRLVRKAPRRCTSRFAPTSDSMIRSWCNTGTTSPVSSGRLG